jgi:N-acetylmuramoyl-L-alanine amidase
MKTWILDAGHGGIDPSGNYTTAPAKMFRFPDGFTIYEGQVNREITKHLTDLLSRENIPFLTVHHRYEDTPLKQRIESARRVQVQHGDCVYLSIHSNAGGGSGFEVFTSPGRTKSDPIAQVFCEKYMAFFPDMRFRADMSDGDHDKEAAFYVLMHTQRPVYIPSLLVENLFFDNRKEAELLVSSSFQLQIALCLLSAIKQVNETL